MRYSIASFVAALWALAAAPVLAQSPSPPPRGDIDAASAPPLEPSSKPLEPVPGEDPAVVKGKSSSPPPRFGIDAASAPPMEPPGKPPEPVPGKDLVMVKSKWSVTIGGWLEADAVYDSTQSFGQATGGTLISKPGTYPGDHDRSQFYIANSRLGFRLSAPQWGGAKPSGYAEFDFNGNQPPGLNETQLFSNAPLRARHVYLKLETDYLDFLAGQTWHLFGWQPLFHPNAVQAQGLPGQLFTRSVQFRVGHIFRSDPVNFEVQVAAVRAPQRDSARPDGQGGLKLTVNKWKGFHVGGAGATPAVDGATLGVSGLVRSFRVINPNGPNSSKRATGWGMSLDAIVPIIPVTSDDHGNKLTLLGSFQTGSGFNDQYTATTGGSVIGGPMGYTANVDNGYARFDSANELHTIDWRVLFIDLQYFFPYNGKFMTSGNYSQMESGNITDFGASAAGVWKKMQWWDVNLFWNVTPAFRFGVEYAFGKQTFGDGSTRSNIRGQFAAFYIL